MKRLLSFVLSCAVAMCSMVAVGCTPQQKIAVVQDVEKFLPVVTNVAEVVCGFTPAAPLCAVGGTAVNASAGVLETALTNYFTAQANGTIPPGVLNALSGAITQFEADASQILDAVHVLDPVKQQQVAALAAAASTLLAVIESLLPATGAQLKFAASRPSNFNLSDFAKSYNQSAATCEKWLPRGTKLKRVHVHNVLLRYTFRLQ